MNASASEEEEEEEEELAAGETTPLQMPASVDEETVGSPEGSPAKSSIEVFDLADSSSESGSPDMDSQAMFVKLKEVRSMTSYFSQADQGHTLVITIQKYLSSKLQ